MVCAGDLQQRYGSSTQDISSSKRASPGLLIGCTIDASSGTLSFSVNGKEVANKFQVWSYIVVILNFWTNGVYPDQTAPVEQSDLGLHYFVHGSEITVFKSNMIFSYTVKPVVKGHPSRHTKSGCLRQVTP